ncbi:PilX N-terminal domain-containing pilus assembly protein [Bacillaceae bacterium S4-13-56]
MKKRMGLLKNEQGIALVIVLLVLVVVSVLGLALMGLALNNMKMSSSERTYQSTYYIAESGITYTMDKVNKGIVDIYNNSPNQTTFFSNVEDMITNLNNEPPYKNFENYFGHTPEAKISIVDVSNNLDSTIRDYKITSIGTIDNHSRTVEKQIRISWVQKNNVTIPDTAVFVRETVNLSGGAKIEGGAGTNSSAPSSINLDGGASISGKIYVGPDSGNNVINKPNWMVLNNEIVKLPAIKTFEMPQFPVFPSNSTPPNEKVFKSNSSYDVIYNGSLRVDNWVADGYTLNMTQDLKFNDIYLTSNNTLNINIGNSNRSIVVNSLNLPNGKINIIGTGKLTIYVNNSITMGAGSIINTSDEIENLNKKGNEDTKSQLIKDQVKKLDIFYKGPNLLLSGSQKIYGSLYAQYADLSFSGGSGFQGHIITGGGKINISGGANAITQLFYAPNADINISGGGTIKGQIIGKSYTASGGSLITLDDFNVADLPPILDETSGGTGSANDIISAQPSREK